MGRSSYKSLNALMRHIRASSGLAIAGSRHKRALAATGYFHGYKGYRFNRTPSARVPYRRFDELVAVIDFDHEVKALLYPLLMRLEMTMKNLALVELLDSGGSSDLADIYKRLMPGNRKDGRRGKLELIHMNNDVLLTRYRREDRIVKHYYDLPDEAVPVWALFEVITLGHFGRFLQQLAPPALVRIAKSWGLRKGDAELVPHLVFGITELRNAVAHNGVVFDTRFASARVRQGIVDLIMRELSLGTAARVGFDTITDYIVLVVFLSAMTGLPKRDAYRVVKAYSALVDILRNRVSVGVFDMIVHTDNRSKLQALGSWVQAL